MTDIQILEHLMYGHHLEPRELEKAERILFELNRSLKHRKN